MNIIYTSKISRRECIQYEKRTFPLCVAFVPWHNTVSKSTRNLGRESHWIQNHQVQQIAAIYTNYAWVFETS